MCGEKYREIAALLISKGNKRENIVPGLPYDLGTKRVESMQDEAREIMVACVEGDRDIALEAC